MYFGINAQIHGHFKTTCCINKMNTYLSNENHDRHIDTKDDTKRVSTLISIVVLVIDGMT